ncbi:MAG TPA: hypothetical protein VHZ03_04725 [Trebonia sp.]|jgi:hypothetical protein|nr:hypothetical protein [Trebonia sp.]
MVFSLDVCLFDMKTPPGPTNVTIAGGANIERDGMHITQVRNLSEARGSRYQGRAATGRPGPFPDPDTKAIVTNALDLMSHEPLSPTVRASMLRVLADSAARRLTAASQEGRISRS